MANYFLNSDGSISTKKKKQNNNYRMDSNGNIKLINNSNTTTSKSKKDDGNFLGAFNDGYDFGDVSKTAFRGVKSLGSAWTNARKKYDSTMQNITRELARDPLQTLKTMGVSVAHGVNKADEALNDTTDDFFDWALKRDKNREKGPTLQEYNAQLRKENKNTKSQKLNDIINPKYYNTKTFENYEKGNLSNTQNVVWNVGENIGNMLPSMAVSTVASPLVGRAMFYTQAQQNYTNEAKQRGYNDANARTYGLIMGGVETGIERLGFDNIGGLKKVASGNTFKAMVGEGLEEFITPYVNRVVRAMYGEKIELPKSANIKDLLSYVSNSSTVKESIQGAVLGALVGGIMNLGGKGIYKVDSVINKVNNNQKITSNDILEATKEIQKSNPKYLDEIVEGLPSVLDEQTIKTIENKIEQKNNKEKPTVPTVQDIVTQENTKKQIVPTGLPIDNQSASRLVEQPVSTNNIARSNESVNVPINTKTVTKLNIEIENALNNKSSNGKTILGKVNSYVIEKVKNIFGIDITNRRHTISNYDIRHMMNEHGNPETESQKGQIAITKEDIKNIPDIISNPTDVVKGTKHKLGETIRYIKNYSDNTTYVVEVIPDNSNGLIIKTMWKKPSTLTNSNAPSSTSKTKGSDISPTLIDNNIPQVDKNVNVSVISNNNTQNVGNNTNKILNPNEISKLTTKDANTTPILPNKEVSTGRGESHFAKNIENKVDMLSKESKAEILDSNEVKYYQEVTNKASLEKAFERLNEGGESETLNWFNKDSSEATDVDVAEGWILLKQYQDKIQNATDLATKDTETRNMVQVAKKLREMGTKAGQTVQAYNILNRLTPEGMVYYAQSELSEAFDVMSKNKTKEWIDSNRDKFNITPQETEFIMKTMQEVQQMEDGYEKRVKLAEIQKVMTDKLPPSKGAGIKAWMRVSMLFNPKTQVRNVMGNAIIAPVNTFSDLFASVVDKQIAKKTGVRTTGTTDIKSYLRGFSKGAYQSYNDFKNGINTRNVQGNRFEVTEGKSFNNNTLIGKALNRVDSLLSFMLDAGDRTFYEATFTNSINNQLKLNNTTEVTQDMIDIATTEALSRTWQDNNGYTRFVLNIRKGLNSLNIGGYGLGDVLIPFAKTPANLTKAIVDYSPAGMIKTINEGINLKRSLSNGQYNAQMQHQFVQDLGKATAGTMLYVLGIALAKAGITNGESDDDKDVANFMKNTLGISSYSIKIGNKSFTYDWAQPIAAPLAITANIMQKQKDGASLKENIMSSLDTAGNILLEQSFLESLNTVLSNNEGIATGIQEAIFELPSRAVPTVFKQIADLIDPVQRQSFEKDKPLESAINKVKAKVPILSKTLAPSVDTMGREIQKYGGKNNIFNVFLNPANINTENISKSAAEIYRLYKLTGDTTIMPRVAPYNINQNGEKILLSSEQRAEYQEISGEIIENSIKELLNKSSYKNLSDTEKASIVNKIVGYSYNKARKEILGIEMDNDYNKINQYIYDGGKVSDYYLNKEEIDYSYNNPEKYQVITQIATYDKYLTYQDEIDNVKTKYTNSTQRKTAVIKYVNSLNLSIPQKAMLIKLNYSSYDSYNDKIIQYVNKQNLTKEEKTKILTKLGFTIRNGRVYS